MLSCWVSLGGQRALEWECSLPPAGVMLQPFFPEHKSFMGEALSTQHRSSFLPPPPQSEDLVGFPEINRMDVWCVGAPRRLWLPECLTHVSRYSASSSSSPVLCEWSYQLMASGGFCFAWWVQAVPCMRLSPQVSGGGVPGRLGSPMDPIMGSGSLIYPHLEGGAIPLRWGSRGGDCVPGGRQVLPWQTSELTLQRHCQGTLNKTLCEAHFFP